MRATARLTDCEIFCTVIDNYGDAAVSWRLARQLAGEHHLPVRLWLDDLRPLAALEPAIRTDAMRQQFAGVDIRFWPQTGFPDTPPAALVIAAFGCHLPESHLERMARRQPPPRWLNLEYLSAEAWVDDCHALPSPHPRLPLVQYFFFPGFTARSGGLLRERDLLARRDAFRADPAAQTAFWQRIGCTPPPSGALRLSLFGYAHAPLARALEHWTHAAEPVWCAVPDSPLADAADAWLATGNSGNVLLQRLPFLSQHDYDQLLWSCDANFVRGEDSLVRAIWAGRPLVWHIYPQDERAHADKLDALLDRMLAAADPTLQTTVRHFWHAWNRLDDGELPALDWLASLPAQQTHMQAWCDTLTGQEDLTTQIAKFARVV